MTRRITILMPNAEDQEADNRLTPRLANLEGKTVGFVDNMVWTSTKIAFGEIERTMREEYGLKGAVYLDMHGQVDGREKLTALVDQVDAAIVALAN